MADDFFRALGKSVARELAQHPRAGEVMDHELARHLQGPMARDQMPRGGRSYDQSMMGGGTSMPMAGSSYDNNMPNNRTKDLVSGFDPHGRDQMPRGARSQNFDQDPNDPMNGQENSTHLDAEDCLLLVRKCVSGLDGEEKGKFIESLSNMITEDTFEQAGISGSGGRTNVPPTRNGNNNNVDPVTGMPRPAGDRGIRSGMRGQRRPGMDSALSPEVRALKERSFNRRFPFLNVQLDPTGR